MDFYEKIIRSNYKNIIFDHLAPLDMPSLVLGPVVSEKIKNR